MTDPDPLARTADPAYMARLDALQAESQARRGELRAIAAQLPATMARTALVRSVATDLWRAPDKAMIVRRAAIKVSKAPRAMARRIVRRARRSPT